MKASQVIEVLEEGKYFAETLENLELDDEVKIFIGEENLIHRIDSCGLIVTKYQLGEFEGFLGILGPIRMPYAYNKALLQEVRKILHG